MAGTNLSITRAGEDHLAVLAEIWMASVSDLVARYEPDYLDELSDPEDRLPGFRHLLATGAMFVASDSGPVGFSAAVVRDGVWFLSQLWVRPERQGEGIGAALLDEALAWGTGARAYTVMSSVHPAARTLYLRRSMFPLWVGEEFRSAEPLAVPDLPAGAEPIEPSDQSWIDDLDRTVRGIVRPEDHRYFQTMANGMALRRGSHPFGYVYAWPDGRTGPGAVEDPGEFPRLLETARHLTGGHLRLMVPSTNWTVLNEVVGLGLRPTGSTTFMATRRLFDGSLYLPGGGLLG